MGRKPKIAAPEGHRGCPQCEQVFPLVDPTTGRSNFTAAGYCQPCARARVAAFRAGKAEELGVVPRARAVAMPPEKQAAAFKAARIASFPAVGGPPQCACCHRAPTQVVAGHQFCDRCAYYVAACGRCCEHSFREFIPELLGRPDPAPLPFVALAPVWHMPEGIQTAARGLDEIDVDPPQRRAS